MVAIRCLHAQWQCMLRDNAAAPASLPQHEWDCLLTVLICWLLESNVIRDALQHQHGGSCKMQHVKLSTAAGVACIPVLLLHCAVCQPSTPALPTLAKHALGQEHHQDPAPFPLNGRQMTVPTRANEDCKHRRRVEGLDTCQFSPVDT
jgi:hypothetical protein